MCGAPGAWLNQVAMRLELHACRVLWSDQVLTTKDDFRLYNANHENPEVNRINENVFRACGMSRYSGKKPKFFDVPFPGPQEIVNKFAEDEHVCIVDSGLCLLWDLWSPYITDLIIVEVGADVTAAFMQQWIDGNMGKSECARLRDFYYEQLEQSASAFDSVYRINNDSLIPSGQDQGWIFHKVGLSDALAEFLNSII